MKIKLYSHLLVSTNTKVRKESLPSASTHAAPHTRTRTRSSTQTAHTRKKCPHTHSSVRGCKNGESLKRVFPRGCLVYSSGAKS